MSFLSLPSASEWGHQTLKISPDELVAAVAAAVEVALHNYGVLPDEPDPCGDAEGYTRATVEITLPSMLVNQLMNGPTGYRAHYSISVEAGEWFNRKLVEAVAPLVIKTVDLYISRFDSQISRFDSQFCSRSLLGPFSKFWYPKELTDPITQADLMTLNELLLHPRWVNYWSLRPKPHKGLLAPISKGILLNGTFVSDDGKVYEQKPCRSQQLFESGWT